MRSPAGSASIGRGGFGLRRRAAALAAALALAGCLSPSNLPGHDYFVLQDHGAATPAARKLPHALLVSPTAASAFYDTQSLVYSRAAGQRAYYQFASWADRPGRRFAELAQTRIEGRGSFEQVAAITAGASGDLLLNTTIEEIYHDDVVPPGRARIAVTAELVDRATRSVLARRTFAADAPVEHENAAAAVAAFDQAVTRMLDELVPWLEAVAEKAPARP